MKLYILLDCGHLEDKQEKQLRKSSAAIVAAIKSFVEANTQMLAESVVNVEESANVLDWQLGVELSVNKPRQLKIVLDYFNGLATTYRIDFVLGILGEQGNREDICFFGYEEGLADRFMIAQYLGGI